MKFKMKLKAAAAILAASFAGVASAGVVNGNGTLPQQQAGSELWLTVWSPTLGGGESYSRDLGVVAKDFLWNGTTAPQDAVAGSGVDYSFAAQPTIASGNVLTAGYKLVFGADSLSGLSSLLAASDAKWAVTGYRTSSTGYILTTASASGVSAPASNVTTASSNGQTYLVGVNATGTPGMPAGNTVSSNGSSIYTPADAGYAGVSGWLDTWGGALPFSDMASVGSSMGFFQLLGGSNTTNPYTNATWTLNSNGTLVYEVAQVAPVPVPLPLALMASGLMMMFGVSRRKSA